MEFKLKRSIDASCISHQQEQEEEKKRRKTAEDRYHCNPDILHISKGNPLWKEAELLAKLALEDHNKKTASSHPPFYNPHLQNAAVEPGDGCSIYYLNLTASLNKGPSYLFETATWVSSDPHPTARVSLPHFTLVADEEERRWSESVVLLPNDPLPKFPANQPLNQEVEAAAEFACSSFASNLQHDFRLVKILQWCSEPHLTYDLYTLTLLAEEDHQVKIFQGDVMCGQYGQPMESAGLTYICKSKLNWPFVTPTWISLNLLFLVRHHFTHTFLFLNTQPLFLSPPSITKLPLLAQSIGPEATRNTLIPFLTSSLYDDVDADVLVMTSELLATFIPYVGGIVHSPCLLPCLEILCSVSHPLVRDAAVDSLTQISNEMSENLVLQLFTPLIERLASGSSTSRAACLGLVDVVFPLLPYTEQKRIMNLYSKLSNEKDLLVRGSAASNLVGFADSIKSPHLEDIISIFKKLTAEVQDDFVRRSAVIGCNRFLRHLEPQYYNEHILPILLKLCQDKFEPIRRIAAKQLHVLSENQGHS